MKHDLVIISSRNKIYRSDKCFEISMGSNVFCVGDNISWTAGSQCGSVGTVIANPTHGNFIICKED